MMYVIHARHCLHMTIIMHI